jgi:hypothetical protein
MTHEHDSHSIPMPIITRPRQGKMQAFASAFPSA